MLQSKRLLIELPTGLQLKGSGCELYCGNSAMQQNIEARLKQRTGPTVVQRVSLGVPTVLRFGTRMMQGQAEAKCFSTPEPAMGILKDVEFVVNLIVVKPCMHFLWK